MSCYSKHEVGHSSRDARVGDVLHPCNGGLFDSPDKQCCVCLYTGTKVRLRVEGGEWINAKFHYRALERPVGHWHRDTFEFGEQGGWMDLATLDPKWEIEVLELPDLTSRIEAVMSSREQLAAAWWIAEHATN